MNKKAEELENEMKIEENLKLSQKKAKADAEKKVNSTTSLWLAFISLAFCTTADRVDAVQINIITT